MVASGDVVSSAGTRSSSSLVRRAISSAQCYRSGRECGPNDAPFLPVAGGCCSSGRYLRRAAVAVVSKSFVVCFSDVAGTLSVKTCDLTNQGMLDSH